MLPSRFTSVKRNYKKAVHNDLHDIYEKVECED